MKIIKMQIRENQAAQRRMVARLSAALATKTVVAPGAAMAVVVAKAAVAVMIVLVAVVFTLLESWRQAKQMRRSSSSGFLVKQKGNSSRAMLP